MRKIQHTNPDGSAVTIWVGERTRIGERARIGERVVIGEWAVIGDGAVIGEWARFGKWAVIGDGARIGERAVIGERAMIGERARIGERAVIGERARRHAVRRDGHVFTVGCRDGEARVFAGCRDFNEAEARVHWGPNHPYHAETTAILDFLFR